MQKYEAYLGSFYKYWNSVTPEDLTNFKKLNLDPAKSYLIIGKLDSLGKFVLLFLMQKYYRYEFHTLSDYIFDYQNEESQILGAELLIIVNYSDYSKSDKIREFVLNSLCAKIIDRALSGTQTLIISNVAIPEISEHCTEFMQAVNISTPTTNGGPIITPTKAPEGDSNY